MSITVTKEFRTAFNFCMAHYEVVEPELSYEKQRVRDNFEQAEKCYLAAYAGLQNKFARVE